MDYFENSQSVQREILSSPLLLERAREAFDDKFETFAFGSTVDLYRIGSLNLGLCIALRKFSASGVFGNSSLYVQECLLEDYCQNAEELFLQGENVPYFCVGVKYGENAGIFTEDLTQNGTQKIKHDSDYCGIVGSENKKVWIDIDHLFKSRTDAIPKYFSDEHIIVL